MVLWLEYILEGRPATRETTNRRPFWVIKRLRMREPANPRGKSMLLSAAVAAAAGIGL